MTYAIHSGARPPAPKNTQATNSKYPTDKLKVDEYYVVPKDEMVEGDTPTKFRNRVNNAVRAYRQKHAKDVRRNADYSPEKYPDVAFTVVLLGEPRDDKEQWSDGDVGVWRDA